MNTIRINPQILEKAKELGLNISQVCENALRLYITAIENANQKITQNPAALTKREVSEPQGSDQWWGSWDLNPGKMEISPANPLFFCFKAFLGIFSFSTN